MMRAIISAWRWLTAPAGSPRGDKLTPATGYCMCTEDKMICDCLPTSFRDLCRPAAKPKTPTYRN